MSNLSKEIWDSEVARREGRLGVYLESLCWRMNCLGGGKKKNGEKRDGRNGAGQNQFLLMGVVLEFVKGAFDRRIENLSHGTSSKGKGVDSTVSKKSNESEVIRAREESHHKGKAAETGNISDTNERNIFSAQPTKCPMLNGGLRSLATDSSSSSHTIPNESPYDNTEMCQGEDEYDFNFEEWGSSLDDFSMWTNMSEMDWNFEGGSTGV